MIKPSRASATPLGHSATCSSVGLVHASATAARKPCSGSRFRSKPPRAFRFAYAPRAWPYLSGQAPRRPPSPGQVSGTRVQPRCFTSNSQAAPWSSWPVVRLVNQSRPCSLRTVAQQANPMRSCSHKPVSNLTLNRSANGTAPWPRGAVRTSSASRPGCCAVVARLASR